MKVKKSVRRSNIELLRIICMLMIITMHFMGHAQRGLHISRGSPEAGAVL